jgi:hypothetical protein
VNLSFEYGKRLEGEMSKNFPNIDVLELAKRAGFEVAVDIGNVYADNALYQVKCKDHLTKFAQLVLLEAARIAMERGKEYGNGTRGDHMAPYNERIARQAGCTSVSIALKKVSERTGK